MRLLSRIKGLLDINLSARPFVSGDFVQGEVKVRVRRPVADADLLLRWICKQRVQSWDGQRRQHFETSEVFSWSVLAHHGLDFDGEQTFPFLFQIPRSHDGHAVDSMDGWGTASARILKAMQGWDTTLAWTLRARLEVDGLDLHDEQPMAVFIQ